jgi:hypothetical protein
VLSPETEFYAATLCVPALVMTLFVLYLYLRDRNRRL